MIGLVVALESEAKSFLESINIEKEFLLAGKKTFLAKVCDKDIALIISGIGKVNAAIATQVLIDTYSPEYVVNYGTAGGMNGSVQIMQYYLIEKCCQYDFDLSALDPVPVGYIQDYDTVFFNCDTKAINFLPISRVASGDRFNDNEFDIKTINDMPCSLRDMEGGAIGQVCTANNVKLIMIKGVTDVYGSGTAQEQFVKNLVAVSKGFSDIIKSVIKCL
ncbi:MAG: 5'-methylthioadenosine/S-adenosylhomocysteine nucleosidase [Clostridiales bacterium]|nr:5'-methylthioadenosine/S-adenosylhomocysteine nucleosidase [Clostridiales bacterium]